MMLDLSVERRDGEYVLIADAEQWRSLWRRHSGFKGGPRRERGGATRSAAALPEVDFESCAVLAIFQGSGWNSDGVELVSATVADGRALLRFDDRSYQTSGPDGGGVRVTAFGIFVLPRSMSEIVLEENVQGLIGRPPKWKLRARFDVPRR
ncbi:hypothetical protein LCGC14_2459370 [marine sediment metagenome]|uniref:Uncharacterized protein n=1 Tax=marine sediment metagenome TaxID=412755 RepID=A0A0F9E7K9_9ZZZZ